MANEGNYKITATLDNGETEGEFNQLVRFDQATAVLEAGIQIVGTTHEALRLGDVAAPQDMILHNTDPTNYVEHGTDSGGTFVPYGTIRPGKFAVVQPASGVTVYLRANTAPVKVDRFIPET